MKKLALYVSGIILAFSLSGCYVAQPAPPPVAYVAPAPYVYHYPYYPYYYSPAYYPAYPAASVGVGIRFGGGYWHHH